MSFLDKLREKIQPQEEENPWEEEEKPKVSESEIEEAIEKMKHSKPGFPWWRVEAGFLILWMIVHVAILYVMVDSPINGGIFVYVVINMYIFARYLLMLGRVNRK